mmetsp:Transcript_17109/g.43839  ORF Transcript_17109/g.43839 Transcript_17109/m.43839 type:complete len:294 (-) Transcript_17109:1494-2375(-)
MRSMRARTSSSGVDGPTANLGCSTSTTQGNQRLIEPSPASVSSSTLSSTELCLMLSLMPDGRPSDAKLSPARARIAAGPPPRMLAASCSSALAMLIAEADSSTPGGSCDGCRSSVSTSASACTCSPSAAGSSSPKSDAPVAVAGRALPSGASLSLATLVAVAGRMGSSGVEALPRMAADSDSDEAPASAEKPDERPAAVRERSSLAIFHDSWKGRHMSCGSVSCAARLLAEATPDERAESRSSSGAEAVCSREGDGESEARPAGRPPLRPCSRDECCGDCCASSASTVSIQLR